MSTKSKKPTGKVAQTIIAMKNIAKRLTAGKTVEVKKEPVKKAAAEKKPATKKPISKPTAAKKNPAPKPVTIKAPDASKPANAAVKSKKPVKASAKPDKPALKKTPAKPTPQKSQVFCVHDLKVKQFVPAKDAKAISVPGFDGIQLFIHKGANDYRISEASSGGLVATGCKQAVAVQMATETLNNHGKPKVLESIQKSIDQMGVVPGFVPPDGVKAPTATAAPAKDEPKQVFKVTTDDGKEIDVTYTPGFMKHLEFRGEISPTGYHSHFGFSGTQDIKEAARVKANELRVAFLKDQARQARKGKPGEKKPQITGRLKKMILAALIDEQKNPKQQVGFDEIVKFTGSPEWDVAATLMVLELASKVKNLPGNCYRLLTAEEQPAISVQPTTVGSPAGKDQPAAGDRPAKATSNRGGKSKGMMSLLDAAAEVLKESKEPLCCKDITRLVFEKKLAESGGLTPHATLSAAMGREITARGKDSRFKRSDRGLFAFNS